jgi:hypothetical protein
MISNEPSSGVDKNICRKILEYLMAKKDYRDDLDGILLGVYEQEIERLSKTTLQNLGYLVSIGIIKEDKNGDGTVWYKISDDSPEDLEILNKFDS